MPRLSKIGAAALAAFGWTGLSTVSASYLVVAGGGGGGSPGVRTGGGGAGGYRTGSLSLNITQSYTVTVGAGGSAGAAGSNSVFSTITSTGGGNGGTFNNVAGATGGSGGGGGGGSTGAAGGAGTSGQGSAGGTGSTSANSGAGGGGGGASAVGGNASGDTGGTGGAGTASSISGSSVTYAGGGGGGAVTTAGSGGAGGGGAGSTSGTATAGTANLGGGGGGTGTGTNAAGGSGIVIISYPAPQKFGGGIVTTSGSNVIHTFNTSGTLTPLSSLTASYLIVAGGGAGGQNGGGGGGAGGFLSGTGLTIDTNSNYLVTVGAGGATTTNAVIAGSGTNSVFSMVTTAAVGGGGAGTYNSINGANGGSGGGGGGGGGSGGTGTSAQGNAGGAGISAGGRNPGGGGGGAGGVGGTATTASTSTGGNGGVGLTSSISGTSTYYAGGGGGAGDVSGTGGLGGGGNASTPSTGTSGTANTGGGGGGTFNNFTAGAGGSGIVIISYAGSTQQMAGGTVTISGGNVIHTFTSSGYLTPIKYVNNSLRFRSSASAYLNRTFKTPTSGTTWTWSGWVKRGILTAGTGTAQQLFSAGSATAFFRFSTTDTLVSGWTGATNLETTAVYRDPAAWYHIMLVVDTTQATSSNRVKYYVNGVQITAFSTTDYPTQNSTTTINSAVAHNIGAYQSASQFFDGYLTEINFIDGQALTPNSFGTFNSYGVWQPITYGGSYGTNGFYLPFTNTTSTTTLGYDFSPNGNNWTTNNISLTAGSTYDSMTDVPTLTSATAANYCVLNPLDKNTNMSPSSGNLDWVNSGATQYSTRSTIFPTSGKWYAEFTISSSSAIIAIANQDAPVQGLNGLNGVYAITTQLFNNSGTAAQTGLASFVASDVIAVAYDAGANSVQFYRNNSTFGTALTPSATGPFCFFVGANGSACTINANFGQRPFTYTPPTGFVALNTYNL